MPYINIEATRAAARRVSDAGEDVAGVCRAARLGDASTELMGSRTAGALDPFSALVDDRMWRLREELHVVSTGMHDLAQHAATATGEA